MPLPGAVPVVLSAGERKTLSKRVRGAKTAYRDRLRAQIVLAAARGRDNARIAADLQVTVDTVRKWRGRFAVRGLAGLADLPRCGRPRRISELTRAAVVALARRAARPDRDTAVALDRAGTAGRDHPGRAGPPALGVIGAADPGRAPGQALAVPIVDLPARPGLHREGDRDLGPVPGVLPGQAAAARQPRPVRGRQALYPRPAAAATPPPRLRAASPSGSSTNTSGMVPWPCSPRSTCTPGTCSPPLRPPPGSSRSWT